MAGRQQRTVHKAALAHIGVAADEQRPCVGLNGGQPAHVLPDLLQVGQTGPLLLHDGAHAPLQPNTCASSPDALIDSESLSAYAAAG